MKDLDVFCSFATFPTEQRLQHEEKEKALLLKNMQQQQQKTISVMFCLSHRLCARSLINPPLAGARSLDEL